MIDLKERLQRNELALGSWITLSHPAIAEIMARAGFDWLAIDLEHSVVSLREAEEMIRVIELCGVVPLVRLSSNDPVQIKRVMDAGAHGIIVPMVNSPEEARRAVAAMKYPPSGQRGVGLARAQGYGMTFETYRAWLDRSSILIVQVEHIRAVEQLHDILSVNGVDGFLVGPYDLSGSLGIPGNFDHPSMLEALEHIRQVARNHKAAPGYHVVPPRPELLVQKMKEGYRFLAYSVDMLFLGETCRHGVQFIKNHIV